MRAAGCSFCRADSGCSIPDRSFYRLNNRDSSRVIVGTTYVNGGHQFVTTVEAGIPWGQKKVLQLFALSGFWHSV